MELPFNDSEVVSRMVNCINELADAKNPVARCGLIYAMAELIDTLSKGLAENEKVYIAKINELEKNQISDEVTNNGDDPAMSHSD